MLQEFYDRINLKSDLSQLAKIICQQYNFGKFLSSNIVLVGYEDFNFILTTDKGKYCVKIFNRERTYKDVQLYIDRIKLANTLEINTPRIYESNKNILCQIKLDDVDFRLCVFEYIEGKSFYDLANAMGILQISYLGNLGKISDEDTFWLTESERGLNFSTPDFWKKIIS